MIFGVGVDIVHVPRVARVYKRFGERFLRCARPPAHNKQLTALPQRRAYNPHEIARFRRTLSRRSEPDAMHFLASRCAIDLETPSLMPNVAKVGGKRSSLQGVRAVADPFPRDVSRLSNLRRPYL